MLLLLRGIIQKDTKAACIVDLFDIFWIPVGEVLFFQSCRLIIITFWPEYFSCDVFALSAPTNSSPLL